MAAIDLFIPSVLSSLELDIEKSLRASLSVYASDPKYNTEKIIDETTPIAVEYCRRHLETKFRLAFVGMMEELLATLQLEAVEQSMELWWRKAGTVFDEGTKARYRREAKRIQKQLGKVRIQGLEKRAATNVRKDTSEVSNARTLSSMFLPFWNKVAPELKQPGCHLSDLRTRTLKESPEYRAFDAGSRKAADGVLKELSKHIDERNTVWATDDAIQAKSLAYRHAAAVVGWSSWRTCTVRNLRRWFRNTPPGLASAG